MSKTIHSAIFVPVDVGNETLVQFSLTRTRHDLPSNFLKPSLRVWFGLEPVGKHQAVSEILEAELTLKVMGDYALARTDSPGNSKD